MAISSDNPQTTAQNFISSSPPEDVAGSDDLVSTLLDVNPVATANVPATEAIAESDGVDFTTITPNPKEPITEFYKRTGHGSVEEFMQDPNNEGKIGRNSKGVPFVRENVEYQVKPNNAPSGGNDFNVNDLTIDPKGTTTAVQAASSIALNKTDIDLPPDGTDTNVQNQSELDFVAEPVAEAKLDGKPVVENDSVLPPVEVLPVANMKMQRQTIEATLPEESKTVFKDIADEIDALGIEPEGEDFYKKIADDISTRIDAYNTKINAIAEEKQTVKFEGWNKFLAVLGAAMGAYGSAMTGTPNYALKIIEGAIDRDAQMFLKSKEIRTKSLENQRADMIMRRGELLQMAQNRTSQLMQSETFKLSKAESKANIIALDKNLAQKELKNKQDYELVMSGQLVSLITSEQSLKSTLNKEQSGRLVTHITFKDGEGNDFIAPAYVAPTEKEAIKDRDKQEATENILLIMDELGPLYEDAARFAPGAFSETRIKINALNAKLESAVKTALGMGANYTPYEVTLVSAQIPSANDWTEMVGTAQKKMNALRNSMVIDMKAARQGVVTNYNTASQTQTIPGLKKGVSTVSK